MFEYVISKTRNNRPTRRFFASWTASVTFHLALFILLIQFPQLLKGTRYHLPFSIMGFQTETQMEDWRMVSFLDDPGRMTAPSAATIAAYAYNRQQGVPGIPPISVRFGEEELKTLEPVDIAKIKQTFVKPDAVPPAEETALADPQNITGIVEDADPDVSATDPGYKIAEKSKTETTPLADRKHVVESAMTISPKQIPDSIPPPAGKTGAGPERPPKASQAIDLFETEGFPLGDYKNIVIERVRGNWFIPSHLKNTLGQTTVVFFINKEGHSTNLRIETSSGFNPLDLAALNAVIDANPFPPLPRGFPGERIGVKLILIVEP
ncbi:MAG TPA: TonB family protein [Acidobacteriota bacterium]|nr:TonB family protein [Acidobacteriota bacterium]